MDLFRRTFGGLLQPLVQPLLQPLRFNRTLMAANTMSSLIRTTDVLIPQS